MEILFRPVKEHEIGVAVDVFLASLADLARRNGQPPPASLTRATVEPVFAHLLRTGIFHVAEAEGRLVSICGAPVRGGVWFLAVFFALPEFQRRKLGRPLLTQVWDDGQRRGA